MDGSVATLTDSHNERGLTKGLALIVILGATATGKSGLASHIAGRFGGEIISCDSRYLYRGMDVGTAKPSAAELRLVRHHLVDILEPEDDYSLAGYLDDAYAAIEDAGRRAKLPIVAGGTPLYLRALLQGWTVPRVPPDVRLRTELEELDAAELHAKVLTTDPVSAQRIGPYNKRRLVRALEVYQVAGRPLSELEGKQPPPYRIQVIGLFQERTALYRRIDERVEWMFSNGILSEAGELIRRGVPLEAASMSAIGYREARAVVLGEMTLDAAIERTCHATHRYVRHQDTWFKRFEGVHWLDSSDPDLVEKAAELVATFLSDQDNDTGSPVREDS